ncbi:HPr family phosphocarrier protein [Caldalkalibacillus thermarum]|uniref:HPr family phosphocarrier protein n=1 Tax=Caldalkalibacillus thermarum TaxID=296745 RepID=UPI00227C95EA|nr:HPr family phosphocarrier protein [Caldalkalibacillus thermarum]
MAESFESNIYFKRQSITCNAKSLLGLVSFFWYLNRGDRFLIQAKGKDAYEAVERLSRFLVDNRHIDLDYWEEAGIDELNRLWKKVGAEPSSFSR